MPTPVNRSSRKQSLNSSLEISKLTFNSARLFGHSYCSCVALCKDPSYEKFRHDIGWQAA